MRKTRDSKPFFFTFAALCGIIPGVVGLGVMTATNSRNEQLESELRRNARPDSIVSETRTYQLGFVQNQIPQLYDI